MTAWAGLGRLGHLQQPVRFERRWLSSRAVQGATWGLRYQQRATSWSYHRSRGGTSAVQASAPQQVVSTAAAAASSLQTAAAQGGGALLAVLDPAVLSATVGASFKLFLICAAVGWLLRRGKIPGSTATVLSQVSFYLLIPAMLFSKVAATLSTQPSGPLLLTIVAVTLAQICLGAFFGRALAPLVDGQYSRDRTILGWHPLNPAKSAAAIAASVGSATGVPLAAQALLPRTKAPPEGIRQLVALSCAFGNSFTLPAVFFMSLLPPALADRALGYAAVFMLAWSPALWSLGYAMVVGGGGGQQAVPLASPAAAAAGSPAPPAPGGSTSSGTAAGGGASVQGPRWKQQQQQQLGGGRAGGQQGAAGGPGPGLQRITSGPDWEVVEGVPPSQGIPYPPPSSPPAASSSLPAGPGGPLSPDTTDLQQQGEGGEGGGPGPGPEGRYHHAVFDVLMQYQLLRALRRFAAQVLNPPVCGILAGMAVGLTPWGRALLASVRGGAGPAALPPELGLVHGVLKSALEVVELLAAGTLATQTLVLAASLLKKDGSDAGAKGGLPKAGPGGSSGGGGGGGGGFLRGAAAVLLPADALEARALAVLSLARFLLVPLGTLGLLWALRCAGWLPPLDPILLFVLLVESVMPSAQNLIIILQLSERTQGTAPAFARLLLKLYAYAVLPVTLWVTAFATRLGVPVGA